MYQDHLEISTRGRSLVDVTARLRQVVLLAGVGTGLCHVFVRHTSASLIIQENADPAVLRDLERYFSELVSEGRPWEHDDEGPDDMPAHVRAVLTRSSETIPIVEGRLALGTWQAVYLWEHRSLPHTRELVVTVLGVSL